MSDKYLIWLNEQINLEKENILKYRNLKNGGYSGYAERERQSTSFLSCLIVSRSAYIKFNKPT